MIHSHNLTYGSDYVELHWTHPKFLPERYKLKYMFTMKHTCTPNYDRNIYETRDTQSLTTDTNSFRISGLRPSSICKLNLVAVYNPASIDSGIEITTTTPDEDTSKRNNGCG